MNPSPLAHIGIVFEKEVRDNLRDWRSLVSTIISAMFTPALLVLLIIIVGRSIFQEALARTVELPVSGAEYAPGLMAYLKQNGVKIMPAPENPEEAVRNGDVNVVLRILPGFSEDFSSGHPAAVQIIADSTRQSAIADIQITRTVLSSYSRMIASMRLLARGIDPGIISPLAIESVDMATPQSQALIFLNMMPYLVIMVVFVGGLHVIIDATAGEKERSSLEPLLILPVKRWAYVVGKLAASVPFALISIIVNLAAFAVAFNLIPLEDYVGFQLTVDLGALWGIFLLTIPMVFLAGALQMVIATFTRSFKEAQTYTSFLPLIPALPGIGLAFLPVKPTLWTMLIPTFGQQILINQFMRAEPVQIADILISSAVTLAAAFLITLVAIRLFNNEKIIFGAR